VIRGARPLERRQAMGFLQRLFGKRKKGTSLYEIPIKSVRNNIRQEREQEAFQLLKDKNPNIPDEHLSILIGFTHAAKQKGIDDFSEFLLSSCQHYMDGYFFIDKSGGKYRLCIPKKNV
jgi:hypothetical protein